jgi:dihydropyrimidine dehydrogenase (NAD+) subunit PreA
MCRRAFEAGWAGVSFKTICSFPQHETSPRFSSIRSHSNSFCGFKNIEQLSDHSVEENMDIFRRLRDEFPDKVIIASIMGQNEEEWTSLAEKCEKAGASLIECNFWCPNMEADDLGITIGQSEELIERVTRAVKRGTSLPVLAKLTPNITDMVPMALAAKRGGADGIAAINTINSITGVDIDTLVAQPDVHGRSMVGGYSGPAVKPIALRFISDLSRCEELRSMHISGMGGIETWRDALEFLLLGAGSLQVTTAVMQYGYRIIDDLTEGLAEYMKCKNVKSVSSLIGAASKTVVAHDRIERDTIVFPVIDKNLCIGCGRCYISCRDGGHQAIEIDPETRIPRLIGAKCVGCHLCVLVCPQKAISGVRKRIEKRK